MVTVKIGDLFESKAQTLVNTVNCVGIMGKGIALGFKKRFPDMFEDYQRRCEAGQVALGRPYLYKRLVQPWVLNFPTKDHWRSVARLSDIEEGLRYLQAHYRKWGITSLAVPPLGCGEGQLEWRIVGPTMYRCLTRLDIDVELFAPFGTPHTELQTEFLAGQPVQVPESRVPPGWVALIEILARIDAQRYRHAVGRTAFQKLAYFATQAGIETGLEFMQASYGPYSEGLAGLHRRMLNHGLVTEERHGQMFTVKPGPTYRDAQRAFRAQLDEMCPAIDRVVDLMLRLDTRRAEVAASVHYAAKVVQNREPQPSEADVVAFVLKWKQRRRPEMTAAEVGSAVRHLGILGWISVKGVDTLEGVEPELAV